MRIPIIVEFRKFDTEERTARRTNDSGVVIGHEKYMSRVLRVEYKDEGVIARLFEGIEVPNDLTKGDMLEVELMGFQTEKDVTFLKVARISKVNGKPNGKAA